MKLRVGLGLSASLSMRVVAAVFLAGAVDVAAQTIDYDADDDGLIEVRTLAQLNAIRWDLDGNGAPTSGNATSYQMAFPSARADMGCPTNTMDADNNDCTGYELEADLDFDTDGDGDVDGDDPNSYANFPPIGGIYAAMFRGNGHTISNLTMATGADWTGLFGGIGSGATIRGVGLITPNISSSGGVDQFVGALAGQNNGMILGCYVSGGTVTTTPIRRITGGLVGRNNNLVRSSYSTATVRNTHLAGPSEQPDGVGGLAGASTSGATIRNSYAAGNVTAHRSGNWGGLVGTAWMGTLTNSYWDNTIQSRSGNSVSSSLGKTTSELQEPTEYGSTGIYSTWDDTDGDAWDFGTSTEYPVLKFDGLDPAVQRNGLRLSPTALRVSPGGSASYRIRLNKRPSAQVTVEVGGATAGVTASPSTLTFTTVNWVAEQTVTVSASSAAAGRTLVLTHSATGGGYSGLSAVRRPSLSVRVVDGEIPVNLAPVAVGEFDDLDLDPGERTEVSLLGKFRDPEGEALAYSAESLNPEVATAEVIQGRLWIEGKTPGLAEITVTARDAYGMSAMQTFRVTVGRVVTFTAPWAAAPEGEAASLQVQLTRRSERPILVQYEFGADDNDATADADPFTDLEQGRGTAKSILFPAGATEAAIEIPFQQDIDIEPAREHLRVRLMEPPADADWVLGQAEADAIIQEGVCDRTPAVRDGLRGSRDCWAPSVADLAGTGYLNLSRRGIASLRERDFLGLAGLRVLHLHGNRLAELPDGLFAGLDSLERLRLDGNRLAMMLQEDLFEGLSLLSSLDLGGNRLSSLPAGLLADAPLLSRLDLGGNRIRSLPDGFFEGASNLSELNLSGNPGAPFTLTMQLVRTDAADHAPGPATVVARIAEGAPFALSTGLLAEDAELSTDSAAIGAGEVSGAPIQVSLAEGGAARLSLSGALEVPSAQCGEVDEGRHPCFQGLALEAGAGLLLFKRAPWVVQAVAEQGVESLGGALSLNLAGFFAADRDDALSYRAESSDPALASVRVSGGVLSIEPNDEGLEGFVTVTLTATDSDGLVVQQSFTVEVSPPPRQFGSGWRLGWLQSRFSLEDRPP